MRFAIASLTYDQQPRVALLVSIVLCVVLFAAVMPALADTVYVDARNGTGLTSGVTDSGFSNSTATCGTVQTRYASASGAWTQVKPTLGVAGGYYDVQVAHSGNSYGNISTDLLTNITLTNATAISGDVKDTGYTAKWRGGSGGYSDCTYYSVGGIKLADGATSPTIRFSYRSGTIGGSSRWNVYGWCFVQLTPHALTVNANPAGGGSVTGAGDYFAGASVTTTASQNDGYLFDKWTDGSGSELSTSPSYTFTMPDSAYTLNAVFRTTTQKILTLTAVPSQAASSLTGGGYHEPSSMVSPTATASAGYTFEKWSTNSAGTDTVTLPYTMPASNTTLYAIFSQNHYTLTGTACSGGTVTGSSGAFTMGSAVTVTATPDAGYSFVGWTTDGCDGTAYVRGGSTYSFNMPANNVTLTAIFGRAKFIETFEGYQTGGTSFESIDKNDSAGPNQSENGSGSPWWGYNPPNGRVHMSNSHSGSQSLWGTAGNCRDFCNLQYRLNGGNPFTGSVYLDWWFYDPLGPAGSTTDFCGDYSALSYYTGVAAETDYPSSGPDPMTGMVQQLALGMSDDLSVGYDSTRYQARIIGDTLAYHAGWSNTTAPRAIGWHHARIVVGPRTLANTNDVSFYIDEMTTPCAGPRGSVTTTGYNIVEINTIMPIAGSSASANGCQYSKYLHFSAVDDVSFGLVPSHPFPGAANPVTAGSLTWNWLDLTGNADAYDLWDAANGGAVKLSTDTPVTSATEGGLQANTQYSRWLRALKSQFCGDIASARTAMPPTYTLALPPIYGTSGSAAVSCSKAQSGVIVVGNSVSFTAVNGFGVGPTRASKYLYVWDRGATEPTDWTAASQWTTGGLTQSPTSPGSYYLHLRACNGDGVANPSTLNLGPYTYIAPVSPEKISDAWAISDGQPLTLTNKAVTAAFANDSFWIEESDRTAAMRVLWPSTSAAWLDHAVTVTGTLDSSARPRTLIASIVDDLGPASPIVNPLEMVIRSIGGADFNAQTRGITSGTGRYNIGLLVRVAGSVSFADNVTDPNNRYFYLDDGSPVASSGHTGVKVRCGAISAPTSGAVKVTGVVSVEESSAGYVPVLIVRGASDILPL